VATVFYVLEYPNRAAADQDTTVTTLYPGGVEVLIYGENTVTPRPGFQWMVSGPPPVDVAITGDPYFLLAYSVDQIGGLPTLVTTTLSAQEMAKLSLVLNAFGPLTAPGALAA
jgi:hypothetical protein